MNGGDDLEHQDPETSFRDWSWKQGATRTLRTKSLRPQNDLLARTSPGAEIRFLRPGSRVSNLKRSVPEPEAPQVKRRPNHLGPRPDPGKRTTDKEIVPADEEAFHEEVGVRRPFSSPPAWALRTRGCWAL